MNELQENLNDWLKHVSKTEQLPASVNAIYIGLFEGDPNYQIYMTGSNAYDSDDDDWACDEDFEPKQKYLDSQVQTGTIEWDTFLNHVVEMVKQHINNHPDSILNKAEHVAAGFDDGDLVLIK